MSRIELNNLSRALELYFTTSEAFYKASLDETAHEAVIEKFTAWVNQKFESDDIQFVTYKDFKERNNEILVLHEADLPEKIKEWRQSFTTDTDGIQFFNSSANRLDQIRSTTIKFGSGDDFLIGFKRIFPTNFLHHKKQYWIIPENETFTHFEKPLFGVSESCDIIYYKTKLYCLNYAVLEKYLGFDSIIQEKAQKTKEIIISAGFLTDESQVILDKSHTLTKRLSKIPEDSKVFKIRAEIISEFASRKFGLNTKDGKIILKNQTDVKKFLHIIRDELVRSELTNAEYLAAEKDIYSGAAALMTE